MDAWKIKEELATDMVKWKGLYKIRYPAKGDGGESWDTTINTVKNLNKENAWRNHTRDGNLSGGSVYFIMNGQKE